MKPVRCAASPAKFKTLLQKARNKGVQMINAPDMVLPNFLSVGNIIFPCTSSSSSARCVCEEGVVVALGAKRRLYVDRAVSAALVSSFFLFLISLFRSLTYALRILWSFSRTASLLWTPSSSSSSAATSALPVLNAWSSWIQYHSQSHSSDSVAARFSSAREGRCRWTMRWRVSRRVMGS